MRPGSEIKLDDRTGLDLLDIVQVSLLTGGGKHLAEQEIRIHELALHPLFCSQIFVNGLDGG